MTALDQSKIYITEPTFLHYSRQSSSERQPNSATLNIGRHLCSAVRPSCWTLAHISSTGKEFPPVYNTNTSGKEWLPLAEIVRDQFLGDRCKTVRPMLSVSCLSCLSICLSSLSVCNVRALWPNGWTDQDETWHAGTPRPWLHSVRWGLSSPPQRGTPPICHRATIIKLSHNHS